MKVIFFDGPVDDNSGSEKRISKRVEKYPYKRVCIQRMSIEFYLIMH